MARRLATCGTTRSSSPLTAPAFLHLADGMTHIRILLNCPDLDTARRIAAALLDERLVACANIYPQVESHYVWQNAREVETEVPLALKTRADLFDRIEARLGELHPYEVPPLVALPLVAIHRPFAAWVDEMTGA